MVVSSYNVLRLDRDGHVATITLDRPERLNALSTDLVTEFHTALDEIDAEPDIRVLILTGAGRGFCSGADVNRQLESLEGRQSESPAPKGPGLTALGPHIRHIRQPVIAAVNGVAAGAGLGIALASDIRIASEEARFSCIFVKRSLHEPFLASFDWADTDNTCDVRFVTTVPTQTLTMINSKFLNDSAETLATRLQKEKPNDLSAQVRRALELATSRLPTQQDVTEGIAFIKNFQSKSNLDENQSLQRYCLLVLNLNEFVFLD